MGKNNEPLNWKQAAAPYIIVWFAACSLAVYTVLKIDHASNSSVRAASDMQAGSVNDHVVITGRTDGPAEVKTFVEIKK
ncbi:MAG: hypothetical protein NT003_05210 [Candidatus Magasanikbacteria bacterium]|nr:hypothetical protein [Candidatus Magasanikbacteria bacterium]